VDSTTIAVFRVADDANGNTLSDPSGKSYTWDFENRLTQAVVPGTGTTTFRYDSFGRSVDTSRNPDQTVTCPRLPHTREYDGIF
jgi:YD repeat-containing protein